MHVEYNRKISSGVRRGAEIILNPCKHMADIFAVSNIGKPLALCKSCYKFAENCKKITKLQYEGYVIFS